MIIISEPRKGYPKTLRAKSIFGEMAVGETREIEADSAARKRWKKSAHWVGSQFGWVFSTRQHDGVLFVTRVA